MLLCTVYIIQASLTYLTTVNTGPLNVALIRLETVGRLDGPDSPVYTQTLIFAIHGGFYKPTSHKRNWMTAKVITKA